MENRKYRCSMTPFICSIVPIGAAGLIGLFVFAFPVESNCFGLPNDIVKFLIPCCTAPLIALLMVPMGIYSVISGVAEIRVPEAKGKTLVVVAIVLGILDIVAGSGFLFYLFLQFSKFS
jgi:uncharacterized membrane protein HdeD (DUF308 family)